jgi:hypothetical protein
MRALALCLSFMIAAPLAAGALDEVPVGHWSYAAINALMQRGLVQGYDAAPYGGPMPMTRAEMAGMVARAVRGVGAAMQQRGQRLEMLAQAPAGGAAAAAAQPESQAPPAVTQEDLARIEKLLAEFRNELVTMGANADRIAADVAELKTALAETRRQVDKVAQEAGRHEIAGYAQMRYTVDGSATPGSQFAVRCAKIGISGPLEKATSYKVEFDVPTQSSTTQSALVLNQAYGAFNARKTTTLVGQFYVPFGWELFTPNRDLEAPQESLAVRTLFADQKYDRGVRIEGDLGRKWHGWAAVVNGTGFRRGDTNDRKNVAVRLAHADKSLEYGVSAYYGKDTAPASGSTPRADASRNLFGAHLLASCGKAVFKGEVIAGKAAASDAIAAGAKEVVGWTVLGGYIPCTKTELALRFHQFDPDRDTAHNSTDVTSLIWLRWLDEAVRLRVAEEFVRPDASANYDIFTTEVQIVY